MSSRGREETDDMEIGMEADGEFMTDELKRPSGGLNIQVRCGEAGEEQCLNGGDCLVSDLDNILDQGPVGFTTCRCTDAWMGSHCEIRRRDHYETIKLNLGSMNDAQLFKAHFAATFSVVTLILLISALSIFVYIRYRRKKRRWVDRQFHATAEELYRQPFNNRSSIVESLSRLNSVRRTQTNNGKESSPQRSAAAGGSSAAPSPSCSTGGGRNTASTRDTNDVIVCHASNSATGESVNDGTGGRGEGEGGDEGGGRGCSNYLTVPMDSKPVEHNAAADSI